MAEDKVGEYELSEEDHSEGKFDVVGHKQVFSKFLVRSLEYRDNSDG